MDDRLYTIVLGNSTRSRLCDLSFFLQMARSGMRGTFFVKGGGLQIERKDGARRVEEEKRRENPENRNGKKIVNSV